MNWFKPHARRLAHAVLSPYGNGVAAMKIRDSGEKASVLAFTQQESGPFNTQLLNQVAADAGIKNQPLITLLGQEHYQTVMLEAPNVPEDEIKTAIRWKVKDLISFHVDDAVLDHLPVPGGSGRPATLYVVAAQIAAIRALAQPYHDAGLLIDVIDVRETAQHNLAMRISPADYAVALLHFDGENGLLTFSFGEHLIMSRRIEGRGATGESLFDKVAMETQRSVDYFERQYSWFPLAKLYLAPTTHSLALLRRLGEYLPVGSENLDMERIFDFSEQAQLNNVSLQNKAFHLLGASLRQGVKAG
jgi:MSHA biogenesis protein MshI